MMQVESHTEADGKETMFFVRYEDGLLIYYAKVIFLDEAQDAWVSINPALPKTLDPERAGNLAKVLEAAVGKIEEMTEQFAGVAND